MAEDPSRATFIGEEEYSLSEDRLKSTGRRHPPPIDCPVSGKPAPSHLNRPIMGLVSIKAAWCVSGLSKGGMFSGFLPVIWPVSVTLACGAKTCVLSR